MTTVRTIAAHEVVERTYPRPPPEEKDHVAMAVGKAIDGAISEWGHRVRIGKRPTATAMQQVAVDLLDEALVEAAVRLEPAGREDALRRIQNVLRAYRESAIFGLTRPRTRVILIDGRVGVYAQPDFWDGRTRFFEMKSYTAIPPPPDVRLQVRLFQLAFPQFESVLFCIDRHADPVRSSATRVPPPSDAETAETLRLAFDLGSRFGREKVLEYMEGPFVRYALPPPPA
jgi:hypothetical protein